MAFKATGLVGFDTEATGLDVPKKCQPFAVGLANENLDHWYCEWDVDPKTRRVSPNPADLKYLRTILSSPKVTKVGFNVPFDVMGLWGIGLDVVTPYHDSQVQFKRARANEYKYSAKYLGEKYLNIPTDDEKELQEVTVIARRIARRYGWRIAEKQEYGKDPVKADYWLPRMIHKLLPGEYRAKLPENAKDLCRIYCLKDCDRALLSHALLNEVMGEKERKGYEKEMRLMPIVVDMQKIGWRVYMDKVEESRRVLMREVEECKRKINRWATVPLDKFTNATIAELLYDELGCVSHDGKRSVDRNHLEIIDHEVADLVLTMRDNEGCVDKFLNSFEYCATKEGDEMVMYPQFNQVGARTFRFSANRPPIQTIPDAGKSKSNMSARQCIGPREGWVWYMIDYSSLQVRIFADLAEDETMLTALRNGVKPHAAAARMAWNGEGNTAGLKIISNTVSLPEYRDPVIKWCKEHDIADLVEKEDWDLIGTALLESHEFDIVDAEHAIGAEKAYSNAKTIFFLKLFGGGAAKAAKGLKCSVKEAAATLKQYEGAMPKLVKFSRDIIRFAKKHGYVETPYGDIIHVDPGFEYKGVNYIVQGSEAAFVKDRMLAAHELIEGTPWRLFGQIHDEICFTVPKGQDDKRTLKKIVQCLEDNTGHFDIETPCSVDRIDKYWNQREKVKL